MYGVPNSERVSVDVDGRTLQLSNLGKVLYADTGFTKGQVIDYYARIADVLLPHLAGRPLTVKRYPDGVDGKFFFEKNAPSHKPAWVRAVELPTPGSTRQRETIRYIVVDGLPTLIWLANLAALELHVPQWTVGPRGGVRGADLMVFDLDPGPPATIVDCAWVAAIVRDVLAEDGLYACAKTSGSKGMQLYVPLEEVDPERPWEYARRLAQRVAKEHPDRVVWQMTKALRSGKVLIDWSQNSAAKTTVAPYSLRARPAPTVSAPVTWEEIEACRTETDLRFTTDEVLERVAEHRDLFQRLRGPGFTLP
ncbi:MAG: ATP-dependent DNA ligase [Geodermatophilaceae bacterium]|nr:ATP-dependent DNA ligase [Geodermatophilaceae bacterium]